MSEVTPLTTPGPISGRDFSNLPPPPTQETQDAWARAQFGTLDQTEGRVASAEETIDRMEHKDRLYKHAGEIALGIRDRNDPDNSIPQTLPERIKVRQIERRVRKQDELIEKRLRKAAEARADEKWVNGNYRDNGAPGAKNAAHEMGWVGRASRTKTRRAIKRAYRKGEIAAHDRTRQLERVKAHMAPTIRMSTVQPKRQELGTSRNSEQLRTAYKRSRSERSHSRAENSKEKIARKSASSRWRNKRQDRAYKKYDRDYDRAETIRRQLDAMGYDTDT